MEVCIATSSSGGGIHSEATGIKSLSQRQSSTRAPSAMPHAVGPSGGAVVAWHSGSEGGRYPSRRAQAAPPSPMTGAGGSVVRVGAGRSSMAVAARREMTSEASAGDGEAGAATVRICTRSSMSTEAVVFVGSKYSDRGSVVAPQKHPDIVICGCRTVGQRRKAGWGSCMG
jgi:hypothetical protein